MSLWTACHGSEGLLSLSAQEYDDPRDAEDAVKGLDDKMIGNQKVKVEIAKSKGRSPAPGGGGDHGRYAGNAGSGARAPPRPGRHRAILKNLPQSFGWKELKDEMRRIGDVVYADVDANGDG
jgi:arginine/serine-rich splicing factor 1/9